MGAGCRGSVARRGADLQPDRGDLACDLDAVWLIHTRAFGSYPNVVVASLLLVVFEQLLIIAAIGFSVISKIENVFTTPSIPRLTTPIT